MDEDYDYDIDYSADELYEYADGFPESMEYNLRDLWSDCLVPTLSDGIASTFKLLICCLLLKLNLALTFMPDYSFHFTSAATGIYCLHSFFGSDILYIILFAAVGYGIMILANDVLKQYQGTVCVFSCFMFAIICELFFAEKSLWHRIRGSQMLLSMKLISLAFDTQFSGNDLPPVIACFGFLFHPGTVIFGPWISYSSYMNSRQSIKVDFSWISSIIRSLIFSFGFLSISTCWTSWFFYSPGWKWIGAYRDALSFRSSHYFVCYMSEATALTSGIRISSVVSALDIEIPRSLVEVVIWWNVPMHFWLKTYVFKTAKPLGDFAAVLLTYVASSLLHGLNFQLAAVLLSLGFYTYIEHVLRRKLASIFKACILARKCKAECNHAYKHTHPYVVIANCAFGFLAVFHLAYLGVMFDSSSCLEEEGYSMNHTLEKWSQLDYSSLWVAMCCYLFYYLI